MRKNKHFSVLLLLLIIVLLFGCEEVQEEQLELPSDEMLIQVTLQNLEKAQKFNALMFEDGIPIKENSKENNYYVADMNELLTYGFDSVASIKEYAKEIFTSTFYTSVEKSSLFSPIYSDTSIYSYAYCYDAYDEEKEKTVVMVHEDGLPIQTSKVEYLQDSIQVVSKTDASAILSLNVMVFGKNDESQEQVLKVKIAMDIDGVWRLNSYTCMTYFVEPNN